MWLDNLFGFVKLLYLVQTAVRTATLALWRWTVKGRNSEVTMMAATD